MIPSEYWRNRLNAMPDRQYIRGNRDDIKPCCGFNEDQLIRIARLYKRSDIHLVWLCIHLTLVNDQTLNSAMLLCNTVENVFQLLGGRSSNGSNENSEFVSELIPIHCIGYSGSSSRVKLRPKIKPSGYG